MILRRLFFVGKTEGGLRGGGFYAKEGRGVDFLVDSLPKVPTCLGKGKTDSVAPSMSGIWKLIF